MRGGLGVCHCCFCLHAAQGSSARLLKLDLVERQLSAESQARTAMWRFLDEH